MSLNRIWRGGHRYADNLYHFNFFLSDTEINWIHLDKKVNRQCEHICEISVWIWARYFIWNTEENCLLVLLFIVQLVAGCTTRSTCTQSMSLCLKLINFEYIARNTNQVYQYFEHLELVNLASIFGWCACVRYCATCLYKTTIKNIMKLNMKSNNCSIVNFIYASLQWSVRPAMLYDNLSSIQRQERKLWAFPVLCGFTSAMMYLSELSGNYNEK